MNRRDATAILAAIAGGTLAISPAFLAACRSAAESEPLLFFTSDEIALLAQAADTILPDTPDSQGAKAAGIGPFMDRYVADCLTPEAQQILRTGLELLDQRSHEQHGNSFLKLPAQEQHEILLALDIEAEQQQAGAAAPHYFTLLKGLTLLGYFTSEAGATQALRYVPVPGRFEGSVPYREGEKAWAI